MTKVNEPKKDWGFYSTTPRIVRTDYKQLTHATKWLYSCLKDLCGDKGVCFRTLESLSEETDFSVGSLYKMIPALHNAGLIHAEKKQRKIGGKPVWHITIVDIWEENAKFCAQQFSKNENTSKKNFQKMKKNFQKMKENPEVFSKNEKEFSNFVDRRIIQKNNPIEEHITEEDSPVPDQNLTSLSSVEDVSFSSESDQMEYLNREGKRNVFSSPEEVWSMIDEFRHLKVPNLPALRRTEKRNSAVQGIVDQQIQKDLFWDVLEDIFNQPTNQKNGFNPKLGIEPIYINNNWEKLAFVLIANNPLKYTQQQEEESEKVITSIAREDALEAAREALLESQKERVELEIKVVPMEDGGWGISYKNPEEEEEAWIFTSLLEWTLFFEEEMRSIRTMRG